MSAAPKLDRYGEIRWTGHFWNGCEGPRNAKGNLYLMSYEIVGAEASSRSYDTVDGIEVTNGTCDGKGWDVVLFGDVVDHKQLKSDAQRVAADLAKQAV
jgi:hypothetical protein